MFPSPQKLPFTIPELVHASPCRSSDGVFYTGKRLPSPSLWGQAQHQGRDLGPDGPAGHRRNRLHTLSRAILRAGTLSTSTGRKQDAWFVVDPESGETQMTLTTEGTSTPRLYIGRTRESGPSCSLPPPPRQPPLLLYPSLAIAIQVELGQSVKLSVNEYFTELRTGDRAVTKIDQHAPPMPLASTPGWVLRGPTPTR